MKRWEYRILAVARDGRLSEINRLGADGWELCAVVDGLGYFKRDIIARKLAEQGDRHARGESSIP